MDRITFIYHPTSGKWYIAENFTSASEAQQFIEQNREVSNYLVGSLDVRGRGWGQIRQSIQSRINTLIVGAEADAEAVAAFEEQAQASAELWMNKETACVDQFHDQTHAIMHNEELTGIEKLTELKKLQENCPTSSGPITLG